MKSIFLMNSFYDKTLQAFLKLHQRWNKLPQHCTLMNLRLKPWWPLWRCFKLPVFPIRSFWTRKTKLNQLGMIAAEASGRRSQQIIIQDRQQCDCGSGCATSGGFYPSKPINSDLIYDTLRQIKIRMFTV